MTRTSRLPSHDDETTTTSAPAACKAEVAVTGCQLLGKAFRKAIVFAPHPDDAELSSGGLIARLADEGCAVTIVTMTDRDGNVSYLRDGAKLHSETDRAAHCLTNGHNGSPPIQVAHFEFPIYEFPVARQRILTSMERVRRDIMPDLVIAPAQGDLHQDHATVLAEAQRSFKGVTLLTYQILHSNFTFQPLVFVRLDRRHIERKIRAVQNYRTQASKPYCSPTVIESQAAVYGAMCGCEYAEAFGVRWIVT